MEPDLWTLLEEDKLGHSSLIPASVTSHSQICDGLGVCRTLNGPGSAASFFLMLPMPHSALEWDTGVLGQPHCGQHQAKTQHLGTTEAAWMRSMGTSPMHPTAHLSSHAGNEAGLDGPTQHIPPQTRVLGVLQVADPAPHPIAILHVCTLQLLEDM